MRFFWKLFKTKSLTSQRTMYFHNRVTIWGVGILTLIQQTFAELLLYARHCLRCFVLERQKAQPYPPEAHYLRFFYNFGSVPLFRNSMLVTLFMEQKWMSSWQILFLMISWLIVTLEAILKMEAVTMKCDRNYPKIDHFILCE